MAERSVLAAVLAGGLGSRLGGEKAGAELAGEPLAAYPVAAARDAGLDTVLVAKPGTALPELGVPVVRELSSPQHPLCGVLAALMDAAPQCEAVLALACDMPFVTAGLLEWLAGLDGAVLLDAAGRLQPLPGRYPPGAAPRVAEAVTRGEAMGAALASLGPRVVGERELARFGDPDRLLFNVNEPADLLAAERLLADDVA